jgi:hypothetical protein
MLSAVDVIINQDDNAGSVLPVISRDSTTFQNV